MQEEDYTDRRRALSPDAQLSRLTAIHVDELKRAFAQARKEEAELTASGAHAGALALKRVEIVQFEDQIARARVAASYRNPDS